QGRGATYANQILVLQPVLHPFAYPAADLVGLLVQQLAMRGQGVSQPSEGLAAEAGALLLIERAGILSLAAAGQGRGAGGGIESLVLLAEQCQLCLLTGADRLLFALQYLGQLGVEFNKPLALLDPLRRRITPALRVPGAEFVTAADVG